ncbi:MAG: hypothetical protein LBT76_01510 [Tannerella sp.]|jgi:hypothetical protein|nr:hypothetical protein [Tannerella sp.]
MNRTGAYVVFLIFVLLATGILRGQNIKLGAEYGFDTYFGDTKKPDGVRESKSAFPYFDDYVFYCGLIGPEQSLDISYAGVKAEFFLPGNRLGIAAGLRVSKYASVFDSDRDYFLWQVRQEGVETDYVRVRAVRQESCYLGVPLEIRFFPNNRELPFQHYFKLGAIFNRRLQTENRIDFPDDAMSRYADSVRDGIEAPANFNARLYPAFGFKIGGFRVGAGRFPWINVEAHFPGIMLASGASSFIKSYSNSGIGLQFSVQVPLGKNAPIGSK